MKTEDIKVWESGKKVRESEKKVRESGKRAKKFNQSRKNCLTNPKITFYIVSGVIKFLPLLCKFLMMKTSQAG